MGLSRVRMEAAEKASWDLLNIGLENGRKGIGSCNDDICWLFYLSVIYFMDG